jgi:hypothetical protein
MREAIVATSRHGLFMSLPDFTERDTIRRAFSAELIAGHGAEIGAGAFPQVLPPGATASHYDLRDAAELRAHFGTETIPVRPVADLPSDFPSRADFLIAHNVLEHAPNPIGELIRWNSWVRDGGVVVLSLPHCLFCADTRRPLTPLSHLIEDFINAADGNDFVSREHCASFAAAWWEEICRPYQSVSVEKFSQIVLYSLAAPRADLHWHTFDSDLAMRTVTAAASLSGTKIELLRYWRPELKQTKGDILIAYRVVNRSAPGDATRNLVRLNAERQRALGEAVDLIERESQAAADRQEPPGPKRRVFPLIKPFSREGEFCFLAPIPARLLAVLKREMKLTIQENGKDLGPADSPHQQIRDRGGGAYSVWDREIYFSSSDRSDCNSNGRRYSIVASAIEDD